MSEPESRLGSLGGGFSLPTEPEPDAEAEIDSEAMTLEAGSADLIEAVQSGNAQEVASAFRAMFEALMRPSDD